MRLIDADALKSEMLSCAPIIVGDFYKILEKIDEAPTLEPDRPHEKWEYLKEHIIELRDANGYATQYGTCQFILNLMGVIEKEGDGK